MLWGKACSRQKRLSAEEAGRPRRKRCGRNGFDTHPFHASPIDADLRQIDRALFTYHKVVLDKGKDRRE